MTGRSTRAAAVTAAVAGLACAGCSRLIPATPTPSRAPAVAHRSPAPAGSTRPGPAAPASSLVTAGLPFSTVQLSAAAKLAVRFAVAWDTWSWRQPPAAWLAVLQPMTAPELYPALAASASTPGMLTVRDAARQAATATVSGAGITDLTTGSVTVTVTVRQVTSSATEVTAATARLAVTLTPAPSGEWQVWDIEPAADGNT